MEFLAHRGLWVRPEQRNVFSSLCGGLDNKYGLETDIRDWHGELVISHDIPRENPIPIEKLFSYYRDKKCTSCLGLNIKSDGLQQKLQEQLQKYEISNYFVFDMSIPDTLSYLKAGLSTFIRCSELENHQELMACTQGIWLDELVVPWIDATVILEKIKKTKRLCIVSSELHGRNHFFQWMEIKKALHLENFSERLMLCTDKPEEAKNFFKI